MGDGRHEAISASIVRHGGLVVERVHVDPVLVTICVVGRELVVLVHARRGRDLVVHGDGRLRLAQAKPVRRHEQMGTNKASAFGREIALSRATQCEGPHVL